MRGFIVLVSLTFTFWSSFTFAYGFYKYGNGRADFAVDYDLQGIMYPAQSIGGSPASIYNFGDIGVSSSSLPTGLTTAIVNNGLMNATNMWASWANISFGNTSGAANTGLIRLNFNNSQTGAETTGYGATSNPGFTNMVFGGQPDANVAWNADNFQWILTHELGHALGLDDLYVPFTYTEEFIDHSLDGNNIPQRDAKGLQDNVMHENLYTGTDYTMPSQSIIDDDEIAGLTWLWGSEFNQIVSGDLATSWNTDNGRDTKAHHGDQASNPLGQWDYRISIKPGGSLNPYIRLDFAGLENFDYTIFGGSKPDITHTDAHIDNIHTFVIQEAGWGGNILFSAQSKYAKEQRIDAVLLGGGQVDDFNLTTNFTGLTFDDVSQWGQVFGPSSVVPIPAAIWLFISGLFGLIGVARIKKT
ncbi:MAG: hypothetical protein GXP22_08605 [Gammaproteobacteria bacterium]|nr:hypothetical protein [Gammaproteobacteria bacterium]